jgi:hypothetical protein
VRRFAITALIAALFGAISAQGALAGPNTVTGQVTRTPVCNPQTGDFEGSFSVTWSVTQNADPGYTITNTDPSTPQVVPYAAGEAGSTQSFSFTLTQTKYYAQDVYGDWDWQYYSPVPKILLVTGYLWIDGWHYYPDLKLPGITGEFKRDKLHSAGDVQDQQAQNVSGSESLPALGNCDEEVISSAPTFEDPTCGDGAVGLTTPDDEGVLYSTEGNVEPGGSVTVTASAKDGYSLSEDSQTEWEHTYPAKAEGCTPPTVVNPPAPDCQFVGADKDGGKDRFGGTNDECAPAPDKATSPVSTAPALAAAPVVNPLALKPLAAEKPSAKAKAKAKSKAKSKVKSKSKAKAKLKGKAKPKAVKPR